jgi:hypothetical protein
MGCMALVFAAAVTFAAHHFNRAYASGFRLNVDLAKRTEDLTRQTEELTAVNSRLEAEIAQRENAESQLHQAQELEALGQLTGGIGWRGDRLLTQGACLAGRIRHNVAVLQRSDFSRAPSRPRRHGKGRGYCHGGVECDRDQGNFAMNSPGRARRTIAC